MTDIYSEAKFYVSGSMSLAGQTNVRNPICIYIDRDGNAVDAEYKKIAEDYGGVISELLSRAENFWGELK